MSLEDYGKVRNILPRLQQNISLIESLPNYSNVRVTWHPNAGVPPSERPSYEEDALCMGSG